MIGANENGEVGTAQTEIRAFQPFFAELDPPRVLTEGDRISLPVVLRNYLERKQTSLAVNIRADVVPVWSGAFIERNSKCQTKISQVVSKSPPHALKTGIRWLVITRSVSVLTAKARFTIFHR